MIHMVESSLNELPSSSGSGSASCPSPAGSATSPHLLFPHSGVTFPPVLAVVRGETPSVSPSGVTTGPSFGSHRSLASENCTCILD